MGGLSVSLAGPDGSVLGGSVAGLLIAAASVQVIVGSFRVDVEKLQKLGRSERLYASPPPPLARPPAKGPRSPPSFGSLSESSGPASPSAPTGHNQHLLETSTNSPPGVPSFLWRDYSIWNRSLRKTMSIIFWICIVNSFNGTR